MYLYHYYDKEAGPFRNLSKLSREEAEDVLRNIRETKPNVQCALRDEDYILTMKS